MHWEELSCKDFDASIKKSEGLCILPMGVLEKHGDHLPLGTDMYIVTEIGMTAGAESPAVLFPYYFMGQIAEARHVKGTIAPSHKLIMDALLEMCDEIHRNGFTKILLLNGHGGNCFFLPFFAQIFPGLNRPYAVYTHFAHDLTKKQYKKIKKHTAVDDMGGHAGFLETALMMHIRPDLVHLDKAIIEESVSLERLKDIAGAGLFTGYNWYANYPHHFAGDPSEATKEHGKFMFDMIRNNVVRVIETIKADNASAMLIQEYNDRVASN